MSLESTIKYGRIGSILNIVVPIISILMLIPLFYWMLVLSFEGFSDFITGVFAGILIAILVASIIAFILFFLAMHRLSKYYKEPAIFRNILYSLILTVISAIIIGITTIVSTLLIGTQLVLNNITDTTIMQTATSVIILIIVVFCIGIFMATINGVFYWRAFTKLGEKSGVDSFKTAGLLYLIGSILQIIGIGAILCWVSWIYVAIGYKQIQPINNSVNYTASNSGKIYCSYYGTENNTDSNSNYCTHCRKALHMNQINI